MIVLFVTKIVIIHLCIIGIKWLLTLPPEKDYFVRYEDKKCSMRMYRWSAFSYASIFGGTVCKQIKKIEKE